MKNSWIKKLFEEVLRKQRRKGLDRVTAGAIIQHLIEVLSREMKEESNKKLRDILDATEDAEKKKKISAEEVMFREKLQKQIDEINAWLEKKRQEAEEERKKLEAILLQLFASLRKSNVVSSEELAPGVLIHVAHCAIFEAQEDITRDFFNGVINERECNRRNRDIVGDYIDKAFNIVMNNTHASKHESLRVVYQERRKEMVDRIHEKTEIERQANREYKNAMAASKTLRATQQFRDISQINRDVSQITMVHEVTKTQDTEIKNEEKKDNIKKPVVEEAKEDINKQEADEAKNALKTKKASSEIPEISPVSTRKSLFKNKNKDGSSSGNSTPSNNNSEVVEPPRPKIGK
jgi:hypothetical protein